MGEQTKDGGPRRAMKRKDLKVCGFRQGNLWGQSQSYHRRFKDVAVISLSQDRAGLRFHYLSADF